MSAGPRLDETLILVDAANTTLGYAPRGECHAGDGLLHRAIAVILVNGAGEILLQHRRSFLWDGYWDLTGATHTFCLDGREETCEEAAQRCLRLEWDIDASVAVTDAFTYFDRHGDSSENEYCVVLTGRYDGPVVPQPAWAHGFQWIDAGACFAAAANPDSPYTPWARIALTRMRDRLASPPVL